MRWGVREAATLAVYRQIAVLFTAAQASVGDLRPSNAAAPQQEITREDGDVGLWWFWDERTSTVSGERGHKGSKGRADRATGGRPS